MRGFMIFETLKCIRDVNLNLVFNAILCYNTVDLYQLKGV